MSELDEAINILINHNHEHFESLAEKGYVVQDTDEVIAANETLEEAGQNAQLIQSVILKAIAKQKKG